MFFIGLYIYFLDGGSVREFLGGGVLEEGVIWVCVFIIFIFFVDF